MKKADFIYELMNTGNLTTTKELKLPTDEEIEKEYAGMSYYSYKRKGLIEGAKWMRDLIAKRLVGNDLC